jgi:hypothetical protein
VVQDFWVWLNNNQVFLEDTELSRETEEEGREHRDEYEKG